MLETELRLEYSTSVVIGSSGTATVIGVGPQYPGESWHITLFSVSASARCKFQIFRGNDTSGASQIDGTVTADLDTSNTDIRLRSGETISFKWSKGTSGTTATVRVEGTRTIPGRRIY